MLNKKYIEREGIGGIFRRYWLKCLVCGYETQKKILDNDIKEMEEHIKLAHGTMK